MDNPKRRTFCSAECVHQHRLRSDGSYLRRWVEKRDRGVCRACGLDTSRLERALIWLLGDVPSWKRLQLDRIREAFFDRYDQDQLESFDHDYEIFKRHRLAAQEVWVGRRARWLQIAITKYPWAFGHSMTGALKLRHLWEADHIVAVSEGGGECSLENMQTLCCPCHKRATKELRGRLASTNKKT